MSVKVSSSFYSSTFLSLKRALYFFVLLLFSLSPLTSSAQKVIDKSQKKRPAWIGTTADGFLYSSATASDLESARQQSLANLKVEMLGAVAENIESSTESRVGMVSEGKEVSSSVNIVQKGYSSVARLPFLSGVSFANATDSYWEKTKDKNGTTSYTFHLLYPFPDSVYKELKREFDRLDGSQASLVSHYEKSVGLFNSVDSLVDALRKVESAEDYFFDNTRRTWAENVAGKYRRRLKALNIVSRQTSANAFECWMELDGKIMSSSLTPKAQSKCAENIKCASDGRIFTITFSDDYCVADDDNIITLTFNINGERVKHELHFTTLH